MDSSDKLEKFLNSLEPYMILVIIASFVGVLGGVFGALFLKTIDIFVAFRNSFFYIILLMPIIGIIVVYLNKKFRCDKNGITLVNKAITKGEEIPSYVTPTLFASTALSHLAGASVGRMEAPIKMGGAIGSYIAKFFGSKKEKRSTIIASGVAALFGSVFGVPVTGTIFAYEICYSKENKKPIYILPVLLAACFSRFVCFAFGLDSFVDRLIYVTHADFTLKQIFLIILLIVLCFLFSLVFNAILKYTKELFAKIKNEYLRIIIGSLIMIGCIYLLQTTIFCGNDTYLIERALENNSMWYIFIVKTLLTALCLAIGFKGGDIGPAFIAGSTLGILLASLMGLDPFLGAAIGTITLFGGVTGCYISSIVLGIEIFGLKAAIFYLIIALIIRYCLKKDIIEKKF